MGYPAKHRTPFGVRPNTSGRFFFVAPGDSYKVDGESFNASDNNDGLSPERALRTIDRAWNLVDSEGNVGDDIILLPGAHTVQTASVAADVPGISLYGQGGRRRTSITTDITADQIINVTAANIAISGLTVIPITASDAIDLSAAADGFHLHDFILDFATPVVSTSTVGLTLAAAEDIVVENFSVKCDGAQGNAIVATAAIDSVIRDFIMLQSAGTWASAILCGAATTQLFIDRGYFLPSAATLTVGINGTGANIASGVLVTDCRFADSVTVAIDNFSAGECEIAENYQLGVGATDGGVLVTAIT